MSDTLAAPEKLSDIDRPLAIVSEAQQPFISSVDLNVNGVCNLACAWCWGPEHSPAIETLTDSDWTSVIDALAVQGLRDVIFTGGEPLLKPGLTKLVAYAKNLDLRTTLSTNGILLTRKPDVLDFVDDLGIPLDANTPDINAIMRPRAGKGGIPHFFASLEALHFVQQNFPDIELTVRTVVSNWNKEHILQIPDTLRNHDIDTTTLRWKLYQLNPVGIRTTDTLNGDWSIPTNEFETYIESINEEHAGSFREIKEQLATTSIGRYVFVEPDGKVYVTVPASNSDSRVVGEHLFIGDLSKQPAKNIIRNIIEGSLHNGNVRTSENTTPVHIRTRGDSYDAKVA